MSVTNKPKRPKPTPIWTATVGNCFVAGYDFANKYKEKSRSGKTTTA